ncbi:hypothetical protein A2Z67_01695 [Candidatus Woesebacteria bacterium RBG_13_36_22]|uniref:Cohesin domain-containing protein n=1 Tax=Candidatus Woesebacteria bacterium RBG_13_36_22 TaxID=1802478 RepID=A0A1F7X567_9BACT|nr:MAG: hypothetical protein A2Z67_01695 [Candidatus Woesebacteria bacterium RBG_13_36_22]
MKKHRLKIAVFLLFSLFFFVPDKAACASEGTVELTSQTNEPSKCFAASLRMQNLEYRILFSCHYLIYPVDETTFNYVMWATPQKGGNPVKLGTLGLGKGEFKTKTPFTSLFVTTESKKDTKTPSGSVVMRGNIKSIEFLEGETTPTPTSSPESDQVQNGEEVKQEEVKQELTTKDKLILALKRAGIAALFALVALIGIIFVISRSRG